MIVFRTVVIGTRHDGGKEGSQQENGAKHQANPLPPGVAPYVVATIDAPKGTTFQHASATDLCNMIVRVASVEEPLNRPLLEKRLRASYNLGSIRAVHEKRIDAAIQAAMDGGHLLRSEDGFFLPTMMEHVVPRYRTGEDEDVRATSNVSSLEIRVAVELQMKSDAARDPAAIVIGAARLLGFALRSQHVARELADKIGIEVAAALRVAIGEDVAPVRHDRGLT